MWLIECAQGFRFDQQISPGDERGNGRERSMINCQRLPISSLLFAPAGILMLKTCTEMPPIQGLVSWYVSIIVDYTRRLPGVCLYGVNGDIEKLQEYQLCF